MDRSPSTKQQVSERSSAVPGAAYCYSREPVRPHCYRCSQAHSRRYPVRTGVIQGETAGGGSRQGHQADLQGSARCSLRLLLQQQPRKDEEVPVGSQERRGNVQRGTEGAERQGWKVLCHQMHEEQVRQHRPGEPQLKREHIKIASEKSTGDPSICSCFVYKQKKSGKS